jgi:hypothetical protein
MRKIWLCKNADINKLNNEILKCQWEQFLHDCTDVDEMSNKLTHKYVRWLGEEYPQN